MIACEPISTPMSCEGTAHAVSCPQHPGLVAWEGPTEKRMRLFDCWRRWSPSQPVFAMLALVRALFG